MSNRRDVNMDRFEISKKAYRELYYFCQQYKEKKAQLNYLRGLTAVPMNGMPKGGSIGNPTERKGMLCLRLASDCELIEQTAIEAGADVYSWLLSNVTEEGKSWENMRPPIGKNQFYERRRKFFYLLAYKKMLI